MGFDTVPITEEAGELIVGSPETDLSVMDGIPKNDRFRGTTQVTASVIALATLPGGRLKFPERASAPAAIRTKFAGIGKHACHATPRQSAATVSCRAKNWTMSFMGRIRLGNC